MAYEYYLSFWGGSADSIAEKLGIAERNFWFNTLDERESFIDKLIQVGRNGLAFRREEGEQTRLKTLAHVVLSYQGKEYKVDYDYGYAYPIDAAHYNFVDGNYSCDCNRSNLINKFYPEFDIELECGEKIELISIDVVHV